jgi:acetolactate synthase-1/2/3 large subunit
VTLSHHIVAALRDAGVDRVFGIPGGAISPLYDALLDSDIGLTICQQETMAVYAAMGYARRRGAPGVVLVTSGPGILNAVTGIAAAFHDEVPLLVFAGDVASANAGRGALQDGGPGGLNIIQMLAPITVLAETLQHPSRALAVVRQALARSISHPSGPTFVRAPLDLLRTRMEVDGSEQVLIPSSAPPVPEAWICGEIGRMLTQAERPLLLVGMGARNAQVAGALHALAEAASCPVATDIEAKGIFPESHPLSLGIYGVGSHGPATSYVEDGVDLLITLGSRLDDTTTAGFSQAIARADRLVQLDANPSRLGKSYRAQLAMACDLGAALVQIQAALSVPQSDRQARRRRIQALRDAFLQANLWITGGPAPHDPRLAIRALQAAAPADAIFTCDIGNHLLFAAQNLIIDTPNRFQVAIGLGGMGSGLGLGMGVQMACGPSTRVIAICGDGGALMVGNELATCAKAGVPLTLAVMNDGLLGMVQHGNERIFGRSHDLSIPEADFVSYALSLGADAARVNHLGDLGPLLKAPRKKPLLLSFPIDPSVHATNAREKTLNFES